MYIQRSTVLIRSGCMEPAVALIKGEVERGHGNGRVLTPRFGQFDRLVMELRFQNLAEYEKFWADWSALPTTPHFGEQWPALSIPGGTSELWENKEPLASQAISKIVNRHEHKVKAGMESQMIDLLKEFRPKFRPFEISTSTFGPNDTVALDFGFESMDEHDQSWADWLSSEPATQFFEKWYQMSEPGGTNEILEVR
jgi:hypothetical protein